MEILNQYYLLFSNMDFLTATLLILGLLCVICEIFQPGLKAMGVCGAMLLLGGVILRLLALREGEEFFSILFALVSIIAVSILVSFIIMVRFSRYSWIKHMPDVSDESQEETDKRYSELCGIEGVALTTLRPVGQAELCGAEYTVLAEGFFINRGEKIKVIRVEQGNIIVVKI